MCSWDTNIVPEGICAWTGTKTYVAWFEQLKKAVVGSYNCHFTAYDYFLRQNPFNGDMYNNDMVDFQGMSSWFRCINDTKLLVDLLDIGRDIFYKPREHDDTYTECMAHESLDLWNCKHWTDDDIWCEATLPFHYIWFMAILAYMLAS